MTKALENMAQEELLLTAKELEAKNRHLKSENQYLQFRLGQLNRLIYGAKRERFISNETHGQTSLPFEVEEKPAENQEKETITYTREKKARTNHPGRIPLPDHLPVEEIVLEPEEDTVGMKCIGREVTDQLELVPAKLFIKRYIRPKYIKPEDKETLIHSGVIAPLPVLPIEKGIAGPGLLAQVMVDKYVDHLPIYRQVQRFARENVRIPANTINGWQDSISGLLRPLFEKQKQLVLGQGYLQVDETPIRVLDKDIKGKCHQGYYWVYNSPIQNVVLYDYRKGRGRAGPKEMLEGFRGYLQSDGYTVYDWFGKKKEITLVNCWAHARSYQYIKIIKSCLFLPLIISLLPAILWRTAFDNNYARPFKNNLSFLSFSQGKILISLSKMSRDAFSKDSLFSLESALA